MLVWCNGMGRAGSTYQYNLVRCFVERTAAGEAHAFIAPEAHRHSRSVPDQQLWEWAKEPYIHIVKMHLVHPWLEDMMSAGRAKVLYIHRDLRDVAVSLKRAFGLRGEDLIKRLNIYLGAYQELARIRESAPERFLWQRYEELMGDPAAAAKEMVDFLRLDVDDDTFEEVLADCSTDSMKAICDALEARLRAEVAEMKRRDPRLAARYLKELGRGSQPGSLMYRIENPLLMYNHISRDNGATGIWRTALPESEIQDLQERYGSWLSEAGYEV